MPEAQASIPATTDEDLVARAQRGDAPAREELFRRHFAVAYRVAHRLLGHDDDAMDALQDGLLKAVRHLAEFDGRSGFRTWLLRVVTNAALDLGRRRRRRMTVPFDDPRGDDDGPAEPTAPPDDPSLPLRREELRATLTRAIDALSPATRTTFVLFAEAELSYKEIAECQGVPIGTVMSRLHFARQKLQASLRDVDLSQ
jgi:RNA polymerase sigma-70 factor (ECF subfamily)